LYLPLLLRGAVITIKLTAVSAIIAFGFSFVGGLGRLSPSRYVRLAAGTYIEFFRGTSLLVQMFWVFYVFPLFGLTVSAFASAVVVLGLNLGAYGSEVVRGGIQAVPRGQLDAALALSFSPWQRFRRIVLPQALQLMIAPFGNLLIVLLKASSLASLITIPDLTFDGETLRATTGNTTLILLMVLLMYFVMSMVIAMATRGLEWRVAMKHGLRRRPRSGTLEPERTGLL
jgi:polar amino acid transport system permease protein